MWLISAVLTTFLVMAGYYGMLYIGDRKYELGLSRQGKWITDTVTLVTGSITLVVCAVLVCKRLPEFSLPQYFLTAALLCAMAFLSVVDIKKQVIPNQVLAFLGLLWIAVAGIYMILNIEKGFALFCRSIAGALAGGLIFLLCYLVSRGQMGAGDVKLAFIMGLYLTGERIMGGILYGTLLCCLYSVVQLFRKRMTIKDGIPMTPFLYTGVLITLFIV